MRSIYPLIRVALFILFIIVIGRPITGCSKSDGPNKTDTLPTLPVKPDSIPYDSAKFLVHFAVNEYNTSGVMPDTVYDNATMVIFVVNGVVRLDSIMNNPSLVKPTSGTAGPYTATYIPDGIGLINITGGSGFVEPGDSVAVIVLTSSGTVTPTWQVKSSSTTTTEGGESVPGWPQGFTFNIRETGVQHAIELFTPGIANYSVDLFKD
jgi:hypothetical protein